ncbi:hypothetical protein IWX49DRAFT_552057 [Phyllosticta citricarpa]|uniref:Uncharacterized protein n=2 Tax=Phyllosticta TaxID=121621 RepID=A0ABR1MJ01_9PEZI
MASRRTSTRSFTSKLNSEPSSYQSGVREGRISSGSSSSSSSISEAALPQQYVPSPIPETPKGQRKQHKKPRRPRRPSLISAPLGTFALIPQLIALGLVFSALIGKLLLDYFGTPSHSITPAPADFGWIEYIPHVRVSVARFSSAAAAQKGGDEDVAFALASPRHFGFARAAWRVFGAVDANANWTDPRKTQPTERESFACRERLRAEYARLAGIWSPLRAEYVHRTISSHEKRMEHMRPVLGGLTGEQLRVVDSVLRTAYRDALFSCMTLVYKRRYLAMFDGSQVPDSEYYFPFTGSEGDVVEERKEPVPTNGAKVVEDEKSVDGDNATV